MAGEIVVNLKGFVEKQPMIAIGASVVAATATYIFFRSRKSDHCKNCVSGTLDREPSHGTMLRIGGVEAYVAKPSEETSSCIVIATDVFGHSLINTQLIADQFASKTGFMCVVPDLFNGNAVPPSALDAILEGPPKDLLGSIGHKIKIGLAYLSFIPWILKHNPTKKMPIFDSVLSELKEKFGMKKIGVIGYCYGGKHAVLLAATDKIDAFAVAHPSFLRTEEIEAINKPGLFLCAEEDPVFPKKASDEAEQILKRKDISAKFVHFPGTKHGFAVRGDVTIEHIKLAKEAALEEAVDFFKLRLDQE